MAIVRSNKRARVSKSNLNFSPETVGTVSSSDDSDGSDLSGFDSGIESDGGGSFDAASGMGAELVRLGNQSFSVPLELYDLKDLSFILSVSNWNELLSEEERFYLSKYLPDMDRETLSKTLIELLSGENLHFGSPVVDFFRKLKGGEFELEVSVYRQGLSSFQKRQHYHQIRKYHNSMIRGLFQIKDAWENCKGYGIEERLWLLNIRRSRREFENGDLETKDQDDEHFWSKKIKFGNEISEGHRMELVDGCGKSNQKIGNMVPWQNVYELTAFGDRNASCRNTQARPILSKSEKKKQFLKRYDEFRDEDYSELPDLIGRKKIANEVTIASYAYVPPDNLKKNKHFDKDWMCSTKIHSQHQMPVGAQVDWSDGSSPNRHPVTYDGKNVSSKKSKAREEFSTHKSKLGSDSGVRPYKAIPAYDSRASLYPHGASKILKEKKVKSKAYQSKYTDMEYSRGRSNIMFDQSEETESDSSGQNEEDEDISPWAKQLEHPKTAISCHESRTDRSLYDPAKVNQLSRYVGKPHILPLESKADIHTQEVESYLRQGKQKACSREKRQEGPVHHVHSLLRTNYQHDYKNVQREEFQDAFDVPANLPNGHAPLGSTYYSKESYMPLLGCKTVLKRRITKVEEIYQEQPYESVYQQLNYKKMDDHVMKKRKKIDAAAGLLTDVTPDTNISGKGTLDNELETRPQKKTFTLITPTIHTGFSFSIIHLLSAIRKAMITSDVVDVTDGGSHVRKNDTKRELPNDTFENGTKSSLSPTSEHTGQSCFPALTVQEISSRVRSNPGDPCILETQEPLQDLIRGVLKIFSSKTAPLGAKGWKALVSYEKSNKGWSWVGPTSISSSDNDIAEEETSPEAWGIPHRMLLNLVNAFANWLKSSQETLQQIGSLPAPPITMLANLDEKERFRDLRTQKNPATINPSSDEQRAYFRKEEFLRYSIPDRAFSYTAYDGKKTSVAPLRRGAGKPTSKARDHYILKTDRPPHVTILCLVRDAAARLPGTIGTRADICTLLRDSQYIVEDVTHTQVNQVVSGALDRLHYELDPCIHFDNDRKLWVYLHSERQEEDFEDDGTASTKNWKRPRKDATEHYDMEAANDVSYHGNEDPSEIVSSAGIDLNSDVNIDS